MERYKQLFETKEQEQTKEFKKWFGKSKAIDNHGNPLIVYHGSNSKFTKINISKSYDSYDSYYGKGFYLTTNKHYAKSYGSNLYELYVKIENPFNINKSKKIKYELAEYFVDSLPKEIHKEDIPYFYKYLQSRSSKSVGDSIKIIFEDGDVVVDKEEFINLLANTIEFSDNFKYGNLQDFSNFLTQYVKQNNYDSIISDIHFSEIVIFYPNQIKSATHNNGNFNPNDNDITK